MLRPLQAIPLRPFPCHNRANAESYSRISARNGGRFCASPHRATIRSGVDQTGGGSDRAVYVGQAAAHRTQALSSVLSTTGRFVTRNSGKLRWKPSSSTTWKRRRRTIEPENVSPGTAAHCAVEASTICWARASSVESPRTTTTGGALLLKTVAVLVVSLIFPPRLRAPAASVFGLR